MPSPQILLIKELRRRIAAGVMDCKQALVRTDGDVEAAIKLLQALSHLFPLTTLAVTSRRMPKVSCPPCAVANRVAFPLRARMTRSSACVGPP